MNAVLDLPAQDSLITALGEAALNNLMRLASRTTGTIVEVGVWRGGSAFCLSDLGRPLYLYDTFTGIPMQGPNDLHVVGDFGDTSYESVCELFKDRPHVQVIRGLFPESMVEMGPIGFAHIDVDQEESARRAVAALSPLMMRGGIMLFDDYMAVKCPGLTAAVDEMFGAYLNINLHSGKAFVLF